MVRFSPGKAPPDHYLQEKFNALSEIIPDKREDVTFAKVDLSQTSEFYEIIDKLHYDDGMSLEALWKPSFLFYKGGKLEVIVHNDNTGRMLGELYHCCLFFDYCKNRSI